MPVRNAELRQGLESEIFRLQREAGALLPRSSGVVRVALFQLMGISNLIAAGGKVEVFDLESFKRFIQPELVNRHPGSPVRREVAELLTKMADRMMDLIRVRNTGREDLFQELAANDPVKSVVTQDVGDKRELCYGIESMHQTWEAIQRVGKLRLPVMVMGETGTGKELIARAVARALHHGNGHPQNGKSEHHPFVPVNAAALTGDLAPALLFGHEKGAFTSADREKEGFFQAAQDGTLFLDEAADMHPLVQSTLLRVLQEKKYHRVGGTKLHDTNAHVVFATAKDIDTERDAGRMRSDLHARLASAFPIELKPLRKRADKPVLIAHFVKGLTPATNLTDGAMNLLMEYPFPENIRELEGVVRSAQVWALIDNEKEPVITADHLYKASRGMRAYREQNSGYANGLIGDNRN